MHARSHTVQTVSLPDAWWGFCAVKATNLLSDYYGLVPSVVNAPQGNG